MIALNMMDEIESRGDWIDHKKLSESLGVPCCTGSCQKQKRH